MTQPPAPRPPVFLPEPPERPSEAAGAGPAPDAWPQTARPDPFPLPEKAPAARRSPSSRMVFVILLALAGMAIASDSAVPLLFGFAFYLLIRPRWRNRD